MGSLTWNGSFFRRDWNFIFRVTKEKTVLTYGMGNRCKGNGLYVLFLDHDMSPREWIEDEMLLLHEMFPQLGTLYLFKTKNGHHVVGLEKMTLGEIIRIMDVCSCDKHYKDIAMYHTRRIWVLRSSPKKDEQREYLGAYANPFSSPNGERSEAHAIYLERFLKVPAEDLEQGGHYDGTKEIEAAWYKT